MRVEPARRIPVSSAEGPFEPQTMRNTVKLISFLASVRAISAAAQGYSPFSDPFYDYLERRNGVLRRQNDGCADNGVQCNDLGATGLCCPEDTICARDAAGNIGCCPLNAACTGLVSGGSVTATATNTGNGESSSTTGFVFGTTTFTSTAGIQTGSLQIPTSGVAGGGSTIEAAGFVFTYIPTSYANSLLCQTAYSVCQQQSSECFDSLGGQNGVTVGGLGQGTTVNGAATSVTNAASVCSSLSQQACYGIQENVCTNFGSGGGIATGGVVQSGNNGPRQTACPGILYAAGAGAFYGAMRGLA